MKAWPQSRHAGRRAFSLVEAMVVAGLIAVLAFLFFGYIQPTMARNGRSLRVQCISNLKQIALAARILANEHNDLYPFARTNAFEPHTGTPLHRNPASARAWMHFQLLSNELSSPKVLLCPADKDRFANAATDFSKGGSSLSALAKRDHSISYFVGLGASEVTPDIIMFGDRHLAPGTSQPLHSSKGVGAVTIQTNSIWRNGGTASFHPNGGNVAVADGSVRQVTDALLQPFLMRALESKGTNANLFLFPQ